MTTIFFNKYSLTLLAFLLLAKCSMYAQPFSSIDLDRDKPAKYENRQLASEKSSDKPIKPVARFFQNTFTHYNFYFNANNKVNDVIEKASTASIDNFNELLPFYKYNFDKTKQYTIDIDSIIYKCTAGILLHNLKNAWIDDLYLLMGKAYLLKNNFDSALYIFQYINYAWATKEADGYDVPLGSNISNTNGVFTIATDEKKGGISKLVSKKPIRNESFLWQIRTLIEKNKFGDATSLIALLRADINFPARLLPALQEVTAYNFYKQQVYDSAAHFLSKSMETTVDKEEKARREFLCGQLYVLANKKVAASEWFTKSIEHTKNPIQEIYARLQLVQQNNKANSQTENLQALYQLGKKDKYIGYKDIIYYAAAVIENQQKNYPAAIVALKKSLLNNFDNAMQKQESFLLLGKSYVANKQFVEAANYYDSVNISSFINKETQEEIEYKKTTLKSVATNIITIKTKDSVLSIAALPEKERNALVKKVLKQLRKAEGLKDVEVADFGSEGLPIAGSVPVAPSLFGEANNDFYFNNAQRKQRGSQEFKTKWGNRPNVDNWRRQQAVQQPTNTGISNTDVDDTPIANTAVQEKETKEGKLTFESLMGNIPLRDEQKKEANKKIEDALFENGQIFQSKLEEYTAAIDAYEQLLNRYTNSIHTEKTINYLLYCYIKTKQTAKADSLKLIQQQKFNSTKNSIVANKAIEQQANNTYQNIYNLFVEGNFAEAKKEKEKADSLLGKNYYTPQLLFIEAVAYVKQQQDSTAVQKLLALQTTYPESPLAERAKTLIDVLKRRTSIENHLANFNEEKNIDEVEKRVDINATTATKIEAKPIQKLDSIVIKQPATISKTLQPTIIAAPIANTKNYQFNPIEVHYVLLLFDKVDAVFINESKNAFTNYFKQNFYNKTIGLSIEKLNANTSFLLMSEFAKAGDAVDMIEAIKPVAATRIITFIPANKYSYVIISASNYKLLQEKNNMEEYQQFLHGIFPDKF
jgi:outer membrane protein assembly factor BamD (BamD/ComL family)